MKELLLYIARSLVQHPDQVTVTEVETGDELTLELRVAPEDMGRVIGRQGRIAKEIRTLIRSYAQRTGVDMSSPEPVNSALALFGELVDELAELL